MDFLRTAPFGALFTCTFAVGGAFHLAFTICGVLAAVAAPTMFTLNGAAATTIGEAIGALAIMLVILMFFNAGVSAFGSLCWLVVRRWLPKPS